jgi:predicted AAA+ superfamily ATPase
MHRSIENYAFDESLIGRHMVFLSGPRQVGKTLLVRIRLKKKVFADNTWVVSAEHQPFCRDLQKLIFPLRLYTLLLDSYFLIDKFPSTRKI